MVAADIAGVFINIDEFGEEITIEGKPVNVVMDNDELKERQGGQDLAVAESTTLFYAKAEDLPKGMKPGRNININGREAIVDDVQTDMGICTVVIRENIVA